MKYQQSIFGQILSLVPRDKFQEIVTKHKGDYRIRTLSCWTQLVSLMYAQLRAKNSLRDIEEGLFVHTAKLYHLGIQPIKRSTLSDANNRRDPGIYEDVFHLLLERCKKVMPKTKRFSQPIISIDSTLIRLCCSLCPWTNYHARKGAVKVHVGLDNDALLPDFVRITHGRVSDMRIAKQITYKPDSILVFDRGYRNYAWYYSLHKQNVTFVARPHAHATYTLIGQHSAPAKNSCVISDEIIQIPQQSSHKKRTYLESLRLITVKDPVSAKILQFFTNNFLFPPETIADIYKNRWTIELFFKWLKQHLQIKSFLGTSQNAIYTQIWIAMITYLLIWFIKHQVQYKYSRLNLLRVLNELLFERTSLLNVLGRLNPDPSFCFHGSQLLLAFP